MIEISKISDKQNGNNVEVRYNFNKQELYNITYKHVMKLNIQEYKRLKKDTIIIAKINKFNLTFETI